jgi:hypothetical protein
MADEPHPLKASRKMGKNAASKAPRFFQIGFTSIATKHQADFSHMGISQYSWNDSCWHPIWMQQRFHQSFDDCPSGSLPGYLPDCGTRPPLPHWATAISLNCRLGKRYPVAAPCKTVLFVHPSL